MLDYSSLFDEVISDNKRFFEGKDRIFKSKREGDILYSSTIEDIFKKIHRILLDSQSSSSMTFEDIISLIYLTPTILKGLIEFKIEQEVKETKNAGFHQDIQELISYTSKACLEVYKKSQKATSFLQEAYYKADSISKNILQKPVDWIFDSVSLQNSHPDLSSMNASIISDISKRRPGVFIVLGNGGIPVGMDVYLRSGIEKTGVIFYPVRFSTHKKKDTNPQISSPELAFISKYLGNGDLFIFDEDSATGNTLELAEIYFRKKIEMKESHIYVLSNCGSYRSENLQNLL